ncbi:MAG: branched-chain amino acid ABC transporter permease, partial [Betaproteobacteria bacterium]|nr:branched-chain amino acid ABC transporter permease [Betaproteobacteria bacterium]
MIYRESGQFKTSYVADQAVFPIAQDRWFIAAWLLVGFVLVPLIANEYMLRAILIPFAIMALAALGLNILVGYCGQLSLGTGGFMAVGAYAAYNLCIRIPELNPIIAFVIAGGFATLVGILFGIPSLRIKGYYLAVATLASQFFLEWLFNRVQWFTNY